MVEKILKLKGNIKEGYGFVEDIDSKKEESSLRRFIEEQYGIQTTHLLHQIHSDIILTDSSGEGDGIIITQKGSAGIVRTADCLPVVLVDRVAGISGIFHSGWRGTELDITGKGVKQMREYGCRNISAVIFPGIGVCCFEIGEELVERFKESQIPVKSKDGKFFGDIRESVRRSLNRGGVVNIVDLFECTCCNDNLFSYRRNKTSKRHATFVVNIS
jgi:polyphenol oxidase